jgi:hypothetical protein
MFVNPFHFSAQSSGPIESIGFLYPRAQALGAIMFMVNKKPQEKLVFSAGFFSVVGAAGAATVGLYPSFRINEANKVSERRIYFLVLYIFGLQKNPAIIRRFHSRHYSSHI